MSEEIKNELSNVDLSTYPEYIQRMRDELVELNNKLSKGNDFLNSEGKDKLVGVRKGLLISQLSCMAAYANILSIRLNAEIALSDASKATESN